LCGRFVLAVINIVVLSAEREQAWWNALREAHANLITFIEKSMHIFLTLLPSSSANPSMIANR
jgi:hypothetical protein